MLDFNCGLYTITAPNGRQYVGSSVNIRKRWHLHLSLLRAGRHHCPPLQRAFVKYGESALVFAKVAFVPRNELVAREQEQIDARGFHNLYNVLPTAGSPLGRVISSDMRARLSAALKGRKFSSETRGKMRVAQIGKTQSLETIAKRIAALRGHTVSAETRARISSAQIGKPRKESPNSSGAVGVTLVQGKWRAQYGAQYLGYHRTADEAAAAITRFLETGEVRTGRTNSKSGFRGVVPHGSRWQAAIRVNGTRHHLGSFMTPEAANAAIIAFKAKLDQDQ